MLELMKVFRLATSYISHLKRILSDEEDGGSDRSDGGVGGDNDAGSDLKRRDGAGAVSLSLVSNIKP